MTELYRTDLEAIRNGIDDDGISAAMPAALHLVQMITEPDPELIKELETIATDQSKRDWSRIAAIYALGWIDREGTSETVIRPIACNPFEPAKVRDHVDEALYYFFNRRRASQYCIDHPDAETYSDMPYREWRDAQTDLAPEDPDSTHRHIEKWEAQGISAKSSSRG